MIKQATTPIKQCSIVFYNQNTTKTVFYKSLVHKALYAIYIYKIQKYSYYHYAILNNIVTLCGVGWFWDLSGWVW